MRIRFRGNKAIILGDFHEIMLFLVLHHSFGRAQPKVDANAANAERETPLFVSTSGGYRGCGN